MLRMRFISSCVILLGGAMIFAQTAIEHPTQAMLDVAQQSFHEYDTGNTFDSVLAGAPNARKEIVFPGHFDPTPHGGSFSPRGHQTTHIEGLVRRSNFIGTGTPLQRWTYPTAGNHFAYSIYAVRVTSSLGGKDTDPLAGQIIYVVRAGGSVEVDGHIFHAVDPEFHLFHLNEEYVFFGQQLAPRLYKVDSESSLLIHQNQVLETGTHVRHEKLFEGRTKQSLLNEVLTAVQQVRSEGREGGF